MIDENRDAKGPGELAWLARALFFLSGAVALAEEVLWMRRFGALLGATAAAAAATLTGVFLGFALGGFAAARFAARVQRPLRAYGRLEIAAALAALLVLPMARGAEALVPALRAALASTPTVARLLETLLTAAIVLLPTACMGATLPLLAPLLGIGGGRSLYAWNTFGAVAGCLAVPFLLLPRLGAERGYLAAASLGAAIGAVAWVADRRADRRARRTAAPSRASPPAPPAERVASRSPAAAATRDEWSAAAANAIAFLSGVVLLALESAWTRLFAQVHESSLLSFSTVVAVFLLALLIGALLVSAAARLRIDRRRVLCCAWAAAGFMTAASPFALVELTDGLEVVSGSHAGARLLGLALLLLLPPIALGAVALPLLLGSARDGSDPRRLGRLLGWNTLGAIVGPLVATFVAFPTIGLYVTFGVAAAIQLIVSVFHFWKPFPLAMRVLFGALISASLFVPILLPEEGELPRVRLDPGERLVELEEGALGVVAVIAGESDSGIKLDNHYTLGGTRATGDQRQLGHLPLLLHAAPRRVAFLGLGTGITGGAAVLHPVEEIFAVELVPEVVDLARRHFALQNLGLFDDPRTRVVVDDARTFLRGATAGGARGGFDVLIGDLVVPWRAGESALYTAEHFRQARAALAPGGLFCQWLPAYQLTLEQFDAIAATFLDVFPRASLWRGDLQPGFPTLGLVGHLQDLDPAAVAARGRALAPKLDAASPYLMHPAGAWLFLIGALDPQAPRFRAARRHSRDFPFLELAGPSHGAPGEPPLLLGAPLESLLIEIAAAPLASTPLSKLGVDELAWRAAGADLWRASVLASRGERDAARSLGMATLAKLPHEIRDAVLGSIGR